MTTSRTLLLSLLLPATLVGCNGCSKPASNEAQATTAQASTTNAPAVSADPTPSAPAEAPPKGEQPRSPAPKSALPNAAPSGSASAIASVATAPAAASASGAPSATPSAPTPANSDIPKPCNDGFGRLGLITFTDQGGGRVRITTSNNASANCTRTAPTQYTCDWTIDGAPTGSFNAKLDPAKKSVSGSIAKGKMFSCPPSSQR